MIDFKLAPEEEAICESYLNLACFGTTGIGGAVGGGIRRCSVNLYGREYLKVHGCLPHGRHKVPIRFPNASGCFEAEFPDRELAEAALVAIIGSRAVYGLLGIRPLGSIVRGIEYESLRQIDIDEDWIGLGEPPEIRHRWRFVGNDLFAPSAPDRGKTRRVVSWVTPAVARAVAAFLSLLGRMSVSEERYTPFIDHTDDYPSVVMRLVFHDLEITVGSKSQGPHHVPWYVDVADRRFVTGSAIPSLALRVLGLRRRYSNIG